MGKKIFTILCSKFLFLFSDRHGISDMKAVETIQDKLIEALKLQLTRNHSTEENLFGTAIVKLSELRALGSHHNELLQYYRANWHRSKTPPLFSEIYDIPKNDPQHLPPVPQVASSENIVSSM